MAGESANTFRQALKFKRMAMRPQDRRRGKKLPRWGYPRAQESSYFTQVNKLLLNPMRAEVSRTLDLNLSAWKEEKERNDSQEQRIVDIMNARRRVEVYIMEHLDDVDIIERADEKENDLMGEVFKNDAWFEEIGQLIARLTGISTEVTGGPDDPPKSTEMGEILIGLAIAIKVFGDRQWDKQTSAILGFDFFTSDAWWGEVRDTWIQENISLIKNVSDDYRNRIQETIFRGIRNDLSVRDITSEVASIGRSMRNRAKLIARDQVGKLNGQIAKRKMTETGIDTYEWLTAADERVRGNPAGLYPKAIPSHFIMNHKLGRWDDDSLFATKSNRDEDGNLIWNNRTSAMPVAIPGEEIQCRCTAIPYMEDLFREIDEEIEEEAA